MYEIDNILWLWLILTVFIIGILFIKNKIWKIKTQNRYFTKSNLKKLSPNISEIKPIIKILMIITGLIFLIVGMINPKIGSKIQTFQRLGVDIVFAVDVSKSMLAEDISPNRINKSKQLVNKIIDKLDGDRVGLIPYAAKAIPLLPMTSDYSSVKMFLQNIDTDMLSSQGTAINEAIKLSSSYFDQDESMERLLFLFSDGEDHSNFTDEIIDTAIKSNIKIYSIGIGTEKGGPIPIKQNGIVLRYKKDLNDEVVITKLNNNFLKNIAEATGGEYMSGENTTYVVDQVINTLSDTEKKELETQKFIEYDDKFQWFILIGFIFIFIDVFMLDGKTIWLKKLNLFNEK